MARKGNKKTLGIERETLYSIAAICSFALGILLALAAFGSAGVAGEKLYGAFSLLLGVGYLLLPLFFLLLSFALVRAAQVRLFGVARATGALLFLASALGLAELAFPGRGGLVGGWLASPFVALFDATASAVLLAAIVLVALALLFNAPLTAHLGTLSERVREWQERRREARDERAANTSAAPEIEEYGADADEAEDEEGGEEDEDADEPESKKDVIEKAKDAVAGVFSPTAAPFGDYDPPPLSLLEKDKGKPNAGDVKANANVIKRTLANFGIVVEIEEVTVGPSVTRYAIKPAEGVRLSKIVGLQNNLELALAAHPVRIEAPIPGRSLVGVEIPNTAKARVGLGALIADPAVRDAPDPLFFPVGRTVSGVIKGTNLAKLPHLLVAGATGAGKSVAIHTLVTSLLYRNSPEALRLILVDPKRVELTLYNGIPHLLSPVLTDPKKAILALKWLVGEMERRYNVLETHRVRDIASYHDTVLADAAEPAETDGEGDDQESGPEPMPYIVVVIDELADIMSSYPRELESAIVRLAQMSRAVGIHLVLSTQRPSVNVITGLIKANIPGRIALQVASQVDSRTILDARGAETLLGSGDMLFSSAEMSKPVRLQGGFISEDEVKKVSKYLSNNYDTEGELDFSDADGDEEEGGFGDGEDDLYEDAREAVIRAKKASTSYLQRKLRIGYSRAARLMDMLEDRSVIGPADGSKPRDVLVESPDENYDE